MKIERIHSSWFLSGFILTLLVTFQTSYVYSKTELNHFLFELQQETDTIPSDDNNLNAVEAELQQKQDSIKRAQQQQQSAVYEKSRKPYFKAPDERGDRYSKPNDRSPLFLGDPSNLDVEIELDTGFNYTVDEKLGGVVYNPTTYYSFDEFDRSRTDELLKEGWQERSAALDGESAVSGRGLIPPIYISPVFDKIFGGSYVEIIPRGFVTLDFGARWQRIDNPSLPIRQQKNGGFEFDQMINMNVVGKIGEKLQVSANFDTNNSFDFQNNLKVEYTGFEEDIIKKLEIGNVSLPINNSLMTGAQNLFGLKTQLQFGKVFVTGVASTQRGKTETVEIQGGGVQSREFEIIGSDYDENRNFFLGHFFRDNYENWLSNIPQITSGIQVTRVEVYLINRNNDTQTLRNVVAFMDLGEGEVIYQDMDGEAIPGLGDVPNDNNANNLFQAVINTGERNANDIDRVLQNPNTFNMDKALHYDKITGARKLDKNEFTIHPELGYISLYRKLQNDEVLAVSYEYTYNGQKFKVGEMNEDYANVSEEDVIFLKMLRPSKINTRDQQNRRIPTWDLMMKNIYNLNASQVNKEGFQFRIIYRDDNTGLDNPSLHEGVNTSDVPLVELLGLDRLNPNGDPPKDGNFDFVDDPIITIDPTKGLIIFPVLEPFGETLKDQFEPFEQELVAKYVFDTLYGTTKAEAELDVNLNKFFLKGKLQAGSSSEILLDGINIAEGSVLVFAGSTPLQEGVDYTIDYNFGKVTIINEGIINSGKNIKIKYEKADLFNFQSRTLLGARVDYIHNDKLNIGGTILHHFERPLVTRISIGEEPTKNTKYGVDLNFRDESRILTRITDALPGIETKAPSTVTVTAEAAQLASGTSNVVNGEGTSYIDDFETTATPFNLGSWQEWKLASTPISPEYDLNPSNNQQDNPEFAYKRAKTAWYIVDNVFYRSGGRNKPSNITDEDLENHYTREVAPVEIFPQRSRQVIETNLPIFDFSYFPSERGQYNFNPDLDPNGLLRNPRTNWGGISRAIRSDVDFDKTNIEYIEFWLLDPFIQGENGVIIDGSDNPENNTTGGKLVFNLGSISEDVMKDGRHAFENGLPPDGDKNTTSVTSNNWGFVTNQQFLNNAFSNDLDSRPNQDVGLDGTQNEEEPVKFSDFLDNLPGNISSEARELINGDPSADNFEYFLGEELDAEDQKILERYKDFNGMDGNSPDLTDNTLPYSPSGSPRPDNEDLNNDNTLIDVEEYYEYEIDLRPGDLEVGNKFIVDKVTSNNNRAEENVTWYLFRIPVRQPDRVIGNINGFKTIRYMRMFMTDWQQPAVIRMSNYRLVASQWRRFEGNLQEKRFDEIPEASDASFTISVVNIEENSQGSEVSPPYVLPPGFSRDRDNTSVIERQLNEQSIQLCVEDLEDKDARAAYKNVTLDLINYGRVKMFLHAHNPRGGVLEDGDVSAFLRMGTDFVANYYEVELPLEITDNSAVSPEEIWPSANEIDIALDDLYRIKSRRNRIRDNNEYLIPYTEQLGKYEITVVGRPDLSTVQTMMIGVRNPSTDTDQNAKNVCLWANELRVTDFDNTKGTAANASVNMKLADFGNISLAGRYVSFGFGGVQTKIQDRTRDYTTDFDVAMSLNLDKFFSPRAGIKLPFYAGYQETQVTPYWNPLDPDIPLENALQSFDNPDSAAAFKKIVIDKTIRRGINLTNVRKVKTNPDSKNHFWDIENISLSGAYNDIRNSNYQISDYNLRTYKGSFDYTYNGNPWFIEPFKNVGFMDSKWLQLIKDFNFSLLPSGGSFRYDLDRKYIKTQYRNSDLTTEGVDPNFEKSFVLNRIYNLRWSFSKNLTLDYNARANAIVDELPGDINSEEQRDFLKDNLLSGGRMKRFDQDWRLNWKIPLDKLPLTDWISSDARYVASYAWVSGALDQLDILGNVIENSRDVGLSGKVDLVKLYNKSSYLKDINTPPRRGRPNPRDTVNVQPERKGSKGFLRFLMMVRSVSGNYNVKEGTSLPGYLPTPRFFGMDENWEAPGWDFIFGSQDPGIRQRAASNDWLVRNPLLTTPFTQIRNENFDLRATIQPFKDFDIILDAKKQVMDRYQENFRIDTATLEFQTFNPSRSGSYNISYNMIRTSFIPDNDDNTNPVFKQFEENREIVRDRLNSIVPSGEYDLNSQDVLIPSFIAAYSGQSAESVALTAFPKFPKLNWRIDYKGLSNLPSLRETFQSISITHSYISSYSVGNYQNSLLYSNGLTLDNRVEDYPLGFQTNDAGELVPVYIINQVLMTERFSPLIGLSVRTKSRLDATFEIKRERALALNLSNAQVTETNNKDYVFSLGFTRNNLKLPFRVQGRTVTLKNDFTFRLDFNIKDAKVVQRKIEELNTITQGNLSYQFRPNFTYLMNQRLSLKFYFERSINQPRVNSSFRRSTTSFGVQVRFSLAQ